MVSGGTLLGIKWPGREVARFPVLVPRLRMSGAIFLLHIYALLAWTGIVLRFMSESVVGITLKVAHCVWLLCSGEKVT